MITYLYKPDRRTVSEFVHDMDIEVNNLIHEFEYNVLLTKYNYFQENGVLLEEESNDNPAKKGIGRAFKNIINTIIDKVVKFGNFIRRKIDEFIAKAKSKKEENEQKKAEKEKAIAKFKENAKKSKDIQDKTVEEFESIDISDADNVEQYAKSIMANQYNSYVKQQKDLAAYTQNIFNKIFKADLENLDRAIDNVSDQNKEIIADMIDDLD